MIRIDAEILAAASIGGISLGARMSDVRASLAQFSISYSYHSFSNVGREYDEIRVESHGLRVLGEDGKVCRVSCRRPYEGRFKGEFYPGMTVGQIRSVARKTELLHGFIIVDDEYGVQIDYPEVYTGRMYDDVDSIDQLPERMPLEEIHVQEPEWWR